ncbi:MAG: hypothetical protein SGARI_000909, partial [Bacillariaceae sp.]
MSEPVNNPYLREIEDTVNEALLFGDDKNDLWIEKLLEDGAEYWMESHYLREIIEKTMELLEEHSDVRIMRLVDGLTSRFQTFDRRFEIGQVRLAELVQMHKEKQNAHALPQQESIVEFATIV